MLCCYKNLQCYLLTYLKMTKMYQKKLLKNTLLTILSTKYLWVLFDFTEIRISLELQFGIPF